MQALDRLNKWSLPSSAEGLEMWREGRDKRRDTLVGFRRQARSVVYSKGILPRRPVHSGRLEGKR